MTAIGVEHAPHQERLDRLSALIVEFGVGLQPDQVLMVDALTGQEHLVRNLARHAYQRGARYVDVRMYDPWVARERLLHASEESLPFYPDWLPHRVRAGAEGGAAIVGFTSSWDPAVGDGIEPHRAALDVGDILPETMELIGRRALPWCLAMGPTQEWASLLHPELSPEAALARLWDDTATVCRLDEPDPVASWRRNAADLAARCSVANDARWDRLRFRGPGTDLEIGLLPGSFWTSALEATPDGREYFANLPSEEMFTTPDPERTHGHARLRKPRTFGDGGRIDEMTMTFESGRLVDVTGDGAIATFVAKLDSDDGARRLGEVALVAGDPPAAQVEPMGSTIVEENAGCHMAVGTHFAATLDQQPERGNRSSIHLDLVIGAPDVEVTAIAADGSERVLISGDTWRF